MHEDTIVNFGLKSLSLTTPVAACAGPSTFTNGVGGQTLLAPVANGGTFTTPPLTAGTKWYACSVCFQHGPLVSH